MRQLAAAITCVIAPLLVGSNAHADEYVRVRLNDGRRVAGVIDARTNGDTLWLRTTGPLMLLQSGFAWDRVHSAQHGDETISAVQLRSLARDRKTAPAPELLEDLKALRAAEERMFTESAGRETLPPVRSLAIYARSANWDADRELDGFEVLVQPLDERGEVVAVNGRIDLRLMGEATDGPPGALFPELGRWSVAVRREEFDRDGAVLRLPFRGFDPQRDFDAGPFAIVDARLQVAGRGTFDASDDHVRLLPTSWMRDRMQQVTGTR